MASERLSMRKAKEILRLYFGLSFGKRQIARSCSISHSTVVEYIRRAEEAGIGWPLPEGIDEASLEAMFFPVKPKQENISKPLPQFEEIHTELRKKGVTLQLLWCEYKEKYPEGYQYSQYCELYRRWQKTLEVSLRQEHRAGEKVFVDFAGKGIDVTDPDTGEVKESEIFVAVLGASSYTYAEAFSSQDLRSWIKGHIHAFEYFDGIPELIIPDNLKAAVTKACRYEPDLNLTYRDMAEHYAAAVIPARIYKPKDKAKVEAGVLLVTRWITAALRKHTFFSITEVNEKIRELLTHLNLRKFKKLDKSRRDLYEAIDKPALKPLPTTRYEYAEWKKATVNIDYHIEIAGHYYSVPYQLIKKQVEAKLTSDTVTVLYKGKRIAVHKRDHIRGAFTTIEGHRPPKHQKYLEWTPERIIRWAESTGAETAALIENILTSKKHPEQGYRSCLGILSLGRKYGNERLEAASKRALAIRAHSYRSVRSILESGFDRIALNEPKEVMPVEHDNIRGNLYYG